MNHKELMVARLQKGETIYRYKEGGNSMVPLLYSQQPCDIRPVDREIRLKDIVFCKVAGRYMTHLVTAIDGNRVQISNNHGHINGWTTKDKVYGIVTASKE